MNTKNAYNKLSPEQQKVRESEVERYLSTRKLMPEMSNELAKAIVNSDEYKQRAPLIKEGKQELRSDKKQMTQLESEVEQDKESLSLKEERLDQLKEKMDITESSEQLGMSEEAISRNKKYNIMYNTDDKVREVCSKINYTRESLGNGREKHTINRKVFSFPKSDEFLFPDMRDKNGKYTMDIMSTGGQNNYETFQKETGMNKLSPDKVYELLGEFAQAMGITSTIDYNFFKGNSAESQGLLQMFRNITGFEGRIPLNITNNGKVIDYLFCRDGRCGFDDDIYGDVAFLSGL